MDVYRAAERLMAMDDAAWHRHANPWSVYSRYTCLPLIVAAIWSRAWLGWWSLVPIALAVGWTLYNPRAFAPAETYETWAGRATVGERLFLARDTTPIPMRHVQFAHWLTALSALGIIPLAYGVWSYDGSATLLGLAVTIGAKLWFCDRMVWLYEDVARDAPERVAPLIRQPAP